MALTMRATLRGPGGYGSELVSLHFKGVLKGELFTISRNWLTLGGLAPPGSARPQMLEPQKTEK